MKLSVLDVTGLIEQTVELAPRVDALGYERYWITEHQPQPTPILTASIVAGLTERIRVGTAGILFHYYPPLRTAHDFHFLERAYEGRIDAGFCGGIYPGMPVDELEGRQLNEIYAAYPQRVRRLVRYLRNTSGYPDFDPKLAWGGTLPDPPQIWSLGGSLKSAELAAELGVCFGYALLYSNSVDDPAAVRRYHKAFVPDRCQPAPRAIVAVCGVCADTDDEARALAAQYRGTFFMPRIVGGPRTCASQLAALCERYGVDEISFADLSVTLPTMTRCYELLADACA